VTERVRRKRRSYSTAFKRRVVAETLEPGASVAAVARRHGLNANMVFLWRGDPRFGPGRDAAVFLPVEVKPAEVPVTSEPAGTCDAGQIEITLVSGHRLMLSGAFDVEVVLRLARGLATP
jgi:transposase